MLILNAILKDLIRFFIFVFLLYSKKIETFASGGQCPYFINNEIQRCVQPVADYAKVLNQQENSTTNVQNSEFGQALQLPKLGGDVFKELCRDFELCVEEYRHKCRKHITINLIEASYGFLCNEGYETFMASAECLMELDQRPSVKSCHDETLKNIEKANNEPDISMPIKLDRMCEALNAFSGCVMNPIRQNCGVPAWQVIFRVLRDTTNTLMPACQFVEHSIIEEANEKIIYIENSLTSTTSTPSTTADLEDKISAEWLYPKSVTTDRLKFGRQNSTKHRYNNSHKVRGSADRNYGDNNYYNNVQKNEDNDGYGTNQGQKYAQVSDVRIGFETDDPNCGLLNSQFSLPLFIFLFICFYLLS